MSLRLCSDKIDPHFSPFSHPSFPKDLHVHVLTFLNEHELRLMDTVNHYFRTPNNHDHKSPIDQACRQIVSQRYPISANLVPHGITYKQLILGEFFNAAGPQVYKVIGEVENIPPIPTKYIESPRNGFKLVYDPEYITIDAEANSPLVLDETKAIDKNHRARLIEDPNRALKMSRKIRVPWTVNNKSLLIQKYMKKSFPSQFEGIDHDGRSKQIIDSMGMGDIGVSSAHWSYQREEVFRDGSFERYDAIERIASRNFLRITSKEDRTDLDFCSYFQSGKVPELRMMRTSPIFPMHDTHYLLAMVWRRTYHTNRFSLEFENYHYFEEDHAIGVSVEASPDLVIPRHCSRRISTPPVKAWSRWGGGRIYD